MDHFAEIILPLPIQGTFTYAIPPEMAESVSEGTRVFVQFGPRKFYTGIVDRLHDEEPENFQAKPIISVLDPQPIIRFPQRKFWQWISDYYLCTVGEVYKAALPSGLKLESESYLSLRDDFEGDVPLSELSEREAEVIQTLEVKKAVRFSEIGGCKSSREYYRAVNSLLEKGIVAVDEKVKTTYRPRRVTYVRLAFAPSEDAYKAAFAQLNRSEKQERMLIAFLEMSGALKGIPGDLPEVEKKALLEKTGLSAAILKGLTGKGILEEYRKEINRFKDDGNKEGDILPELTEAQSIAYDELKKVMPLHDVTLLHGVTGSGKTEIYSRLISEQLDRGRQVLYLVPEISLTTQLTNRLRKIFGDRLLVYHSKFSDNERVDIWNRLLATVKPMLVLGVRSSVFLPLSNLGLVIVDEEHESSYKQYDPAPRYNARDAAIVLGVFFGAKTLLGSATPSVETYYKATTGKYGLVELNERYEGGKLPEVTVVDMKRERKRKENRGILSSELYAKTIAALDRHEQAIMFQNRRGFSTVVVCKECGWVPKCRNCDVSLIYHKGVNQLRCHYCGYSVPLPNLCPACGLNGIEVYGYGTERIAEDLAREFTQAKIARMDLDTTRNKDSYQDIIDTFSAGKTDILTGTQMVTKGLDFDRVKIVGVMNADTLLHFPDFRAQERAFNMLVQVAGRAGRRKERGEVIIQTTDPSNEVLKYVKSHDYKGFYNAEILDRERFDYPPFRRIINIFLKHRESHILDEIAVKYALTLRKVFGERVLGPERPSVGRISNFYYQCIMLKIEPEASLKKVKAILRDIYERMCADGKMKSVIVYYDVDPV